MSNILSKFLTIGAGNTPMTLFVIRRSATVGDNNSPISIRLNKFLTLWTFEQVKMDF